MTDVPLRILIAEYAEAAAAHGAATDDGDHKSANRHYGVLATSYNELRTRGVEAQNALLPLLEHPNRWVQSWAAAHALEFAPALGEPRLLRIAELDGIIGFNAEMTLAEWRKGNLRFP